MTDQDLETRLLKQEAVHEVHNLIGRYEFWHAANLHRRCLQLYALETPGVRIAMDWGVYEGRAGVERFLLGYHGGHEAENPDASAIGELHLHLQTTPIVEVADDLRTARAVTISPGVETMPAPDGILSLWAWLKYGWDFVQENGTWKIWHQHVYATFVTPYDKSWVEHKPQPRKRQFPPVSAPDYELPTPGPWTYQTDKPQVNVPAPPEPYATFEAAAPFELG
jgi:hypothetical protein